MMECINWSAGLLGIVLLWIPSILIVFWIQAANNKADKRYEEQLREIKQQYKYK